MTNMARRRSADTAKAPDEGNALPLGTRVPSRDRFHFYDDVEVNTLPPLEWIVQDILPARALAEVHAPPESAKTFLTISLALSIAADEPFAGYSVSPGPVVYVAAEGSAGVARRVNAWKEAAGYSTERRVGVLFMTEPMQLLETGDVGTFLAALDTLEERPVLIVIDTLALCMVGGDDNFAKDMGLVIAAADKIRRSTGATVLLVHHTTKNGEMERGSTALRGAMDVMIALKREDNRVTVTCDKMKDAAHFPALIFELTPVADSCALVTAKSGWQQPNDKPTPKQLEALEALAASSLDEGLSLTAWMAASGIAARSFYRLRTALVASDFVEREGKSYIITSKGRAALTANCQPTANQLPGSKEDSLPAKGPLFRGPRHGSNPADNTDRNYVEDERAGMEADR